MELFRDLVQEFQHAAARGGAPHWQEATRTVGHEGMGRAFPLMTESLGRELERLFAPAVPAEATAEALENTGAPQFGQQFPYSFPSLSTSVDQADTLSVLGRYHMQSHGGGLPSGSLESTSASMGLRSQLDEAEAETMVRAVVEKTFSWYLPNSDTDMTSDSSFAELGLGSFEWILMREGLRQELGLEAVPLHLFYTTPSVGALSHHLTELVVTLGSSTPKPSKPVDPPLEQQLNLSASPGETRFGAADQRMAPMRSPAPTLASPALLQERKASPSADIMSRFMPGAMLPRKVSPHQIGQDSRIDPRVVFEGPVIIGDRTILKGDVRIGGQTEIMDDVRIVGNCRLGSANKVNEDVRIRGDVVIGNSNKVDGQVIIEGPVQIGDGNHLEVRVRVGQVDESMCGQITIGNNNFFAASSVVFQPRGKFPTTWREGQKHKMLPSETRIGNDAFISMGAGVSHDCVLEDRVSLGGGLSGYCHLMKGCRTAPGTFLHQFTTLGPGVFVTLSVKVVADVLPFTVLNADGRLLVDTVGLSRQGVKIDDARALENFYRRHFANTSATYLREIPPAGQEECKGKWFKDVLTEFFEARNCMRDMRPLHMITIPT